MEGRARGMLHYPLGCPESLGVDDRVLCRTSKAVTDPSRLDLAVSGVQGVGRTTQDKLKALGVHTIGDLLLHLPFRHEPPSRLSRICDIRSGEEVTLRTRVVSCSVRDTSRRRVKVLEALVSDDSGSTIATWYNQAYLAAAFQSRPEVWLRGVVTPKRGGSTFVVKRHEILGEGEESLHVLGLVPVYPSTGDLSVRTIRTVLHRATPELRHMVDPVPARVLAERGYAGKREAVWASHFPVTLKEARMARDRLAFEELLLLQLAVLQKRAGQEATRKSRPLSTPADVSAKFIKGLPYRPTNAQDRVMHEIEAGPGA